MSAMAEKSPAAQAQFEAARKDFEPGFDPRRKPGRGRPSMLNDPEMVEKFAEAVAEGLTNQQLGDAFKIHMRTARYYKKDARVKAAALKYVEDRIIRVTRRTDAKLDSLLASDEFKGLPIEEQVMLLLKVRKEYLGGVMRLQAEGGKPDAGAINDAMDAIESDPEFAAGIKALMERSSTSDEE